MPFRGSVSRPNFAPGCYHLEAPEHPLSSGIFFNDAGGDWHANTGFRGAVALVCSMDNSMTYGLGVHRIRPALETEPTCPTNAAPVSSSAQCEEYAKLDGKSFATANLPNYPRGCSDRISHPDYAGVVWNEDEVGTWDQHQGFTGAVALVCEPATAKPDCFPVHFGRTYVVHVGGLAPWRSVKITGPDPEGTYRGKLQGWAVRNKIAPSDLRQAAGDETCACPPQ